MILYDIKSVLRDKCVIDIDQIEDKQFNSFDEYLFLFPKQKKLVYAYLKCFVGTIKLSEVHKLFSKFDDLDWLLTSRTHKKRIEEDQCYAIVVSKYIRNPYTWISSMINVQPYLFDAKYLLIGSFQEVAAKCTHKWLHTQSMHYSGIYNHVRTLKGLVKHNDLFIERMKIEKQFFKSLLSKITFSTSLRVHSYYKYIEVFDENSQLAIQFELNDLEVKTRIIFLKNSRQRGRKQNTFITMKLLSRYAELFNLYNVLANSQDKINQYLQSLQNLKITYSDTYDRLYASTVQILTDFENAEDGAYLPNKFMHLYMVQNDAVERVSLSISRKYKKLRIYRAVKLLDDKLNRFEEIAYSSYNMQSKDLGICAEELLLSGFINIGHIEEKHSLYDYELLATKKSQSFALQFLKLPQMTANRLFDEYDNVQEQMKNDFEYYRTNSIQIDDTRVKIKHDDTVNTYFEQFQLDKNSEFFEDSRQKSLYDKKQLIRKFNKTYSKQIKENEENQ